MAGKARVGKDPSSETRQKDLRCCRKRTGSSKKIRERRITPSFSRPTCAPACRPKPYPSPSSCAAWIPTRPLPGKTIQPDRHRRRQEFPIEQLLDSARLSVLNNRSAKKAATEAEDRTRLREDKRDDEATIRGGRAALNLGRFNLEREVMLRSAEIFIFTMDYSDHSPDSCTALQCIPSNYHRLNL